MGYQENVQHAEEKVSIQLEKIYQLVGKKAEIAEIQMEYQKYMQKLSALYQ